MVRRDVERLEVPPVVFDLGPLEDLEAEGVQDLSQLALHGHRGVQVPDPHRYAWRGHVDALPRQPPLKVAGLELLSALGDRRLDLASHLVRQLADCRPFGSVNRAKPAEEKRQLP